jgi:branched-chain amino acid transport system substrate-binding protein
MEVSEMSKKLKIYMIILAVIIAVSLISTLVFAGKEEKDAGDMNEIRIGLAYPHSGYTAEFGRIGEQGITMALEELDYTIAGRPVKTFSVDTKCDTSVANEKFRELVERYNPHVIIGAVCGNVGLAVADLAKEYPDIAFLIAYAATEDVTMRKHQHNVLRAGWTGEQLNTSLGEWTAEDMGWKKIIIIGQDYAFTWGQTQGFLRGFCRAGGEEIHRIYHPVNMDDYSSYLLQVRQIADEYDAVVLNTSGSDMANLFKQYFEFGLDKVLPVFGMTNAFDGTVLPTLGEDAIGMVSEMHYAEGKEYAESGMFPAQEIENWLTFKNDYMERFDGEIPAAVAEQAYVSINIIRKAVEGLDGNIEDSQAFIDALYKVEMPEAPRGPLYFDEYGHNVQQTYIREVQVHDGSMVNVPIKVYKNVSQFVGYENRKDDYMRQPVPTPTFPPDDCDLLDDEGLGPWEY